MIGVEIFKCQFVAVRFCWFLMFDISLCQVKMPTSCSAPNCGNTSSASYSFKLIQTAGRNEWIDASGCTDWNPPARGRLREVNIHLINNILKTAI